MRPRYRVGLLACLLCGIASAASAQATANRTGTLSATGSVVLATERMGTASVDVRGTYAGTIVFEVSGNGGDYVAIDCATPSDPGTSVNGPAPNSTGLWSCAVAGYQTFRARMSAYTSGTATVTLTAVGTGGGGGGSGVAGLGGGTVIVTDEIDAFTADINAAGQLATTCANCSGAGVSLNEDAPFGDGAALTPSGMLRQGTPANTSGADGDIEPLRGDAGRLWTSTVLTDGTDTALITAGGALNAVVTDGAGALNVIVDSGALTATVTDGAGALNVIVDSGVITTVSTVTAATLTAGDLDLGNVDLEIAGTAIAVNAGAASAQTLRTVTATDDPGVASLAIIAGDTTDIEAALEGARTPVSPGAATATLGLLAGGQYNITPPTFTDGQQGSIQFNSAGALIVTGGGGGTEYVVNAVAPADPTGSTPIMERDDALATLTEIEGDWTNWRSNARGAAWVAIDNTVATTVTDGAGALNVIVDSGTVTVSDGAGALNTIVDSGTITAVTAITNPVTVTDGAGALNVIVDSGAMTATVTDGAGALNVIVDSGALTVSDGAGALNVIVDSGTVTTVSTVTNVATIGTSVTPGTAATNLGKAVDAVAGATDTGVALLVVRDDALTTLTPADGDYTSLRVSSTGALHVTGAAGTTQYVEDAAATDGASLVAIGGIRRDTTPSSSAGTAGDNATVSLDANGRLYTNAVLYDAAGAALTVSTDATHDSAATATGPQTLVAFDDTAPASVTEGDAVRQRGSATGEAYSVVRDAAGNNRGANVNAANEMLVSCAGCAGGTQYTQDVALTVATSVGVMAMGRASAAAPTNVSAGDDAVLPWYLLSGAQAVQPTFGGVLSVTGNGTAGTGTQRVTIASDNTAFSVNVGTFPDNEPVNTQQWGGSTVTGGAGVTAAGSPRITIATDDPVNDSLDLLDNAVSGAGFNITQMNGVAVSMGVGASGTGTQRVASLIHDGTDTALVDSAFGGSLQVIDSTNATYLLALSTALQAEDVASAAGDEGLVLFGIRDDTLDARATTEGDFEYLHTNSVGALWVAGNGTFTVGDGAGALNVICDSGCAGGTQYAEDAAHASGNTGTLTLAVRNDAGTALAADGDNIPLMVNASGALFVTGGGGGTEYVVNAVAPADPTGATFTMERDDALATLAEIETDWTNPRSNARGALWVDIDPTVALTVASHAVTLTSGTVTTLSQLGGVALPVEDAPETAAGVGIYAMGVRRDTVATSAGTAGDNVMASYDALGRLWVRQGDPCSDHSRTLSAAIDTAASGNVEIVALNGSDLIYICAIDVVVDAAVDIQLIYGTGTACATGETNLTGIWGFAANGGIAKNKGTGQYYTVPAGNAFCIETSGAIQTSGSVTYVRTAAP